MKQSTGLCNMKKFNFIFIFLGILFMSLFFISLISAAALQVTEEHPFLINGSWISAHDLKIGDILQTADGKKVRITAIEDIISKENFPVYNLEAGIYHDFVVNGGDNLEVIVHNSNNLGVCFSADTLISLADGTKKEIKNINKGDQVLSFNFTNNQYEFSTVNQISKHLSDDIYLINNKIKVTSGHPFWTKELGWAAINDSEIKEHPELKLAKLEIGLHLLDDSGDYVEIISIQKLFNSSIEVYNFVDLGINHNYFAGGVLVHNVGNPCAQEGVTELAFTPNKLTVEQLQARLTKPGGSAEIARRQAESILNKMDMTGGVNPAASNIYAKNYEIAVKDHRWGSELSLDDWGDGPIYDMNVVQRFNSNLEALAEMRNPSLPRGENRRFSTATTFDSGDTSRWQRVNIEVKKNIWNNPSQQGYISSGVYYKRDYPYTVKIGGVSKNVKVSHQFTVGMPGTTPGSIRFHADGAVRTGVRSAEGEETVEGFEGLLNLLDDLRFKAISSAKKIEKARAIAEFEWVHSVTSPSGFGGGTVLMDIDIKLLEQAGFASSIPKSYRRIELEALAMPRDDWIKLRTNELMGDKPKSFWKWFS